MASDDNDEVVGGRYVLGRLLGRGGMAEVYEGHDQRLGRQVAVKQLSAHLAADPDAHVRFDREAHAAASLNHPAIASVFDTGSDLNDGTGVAIPYIVMELVDGETVQALLRRKPPMPLEQALTITSRVLEALEHSHAAGIIHRDIKPSNVMVTSTGAVKVMDFGIARAIDDTSNGLTQTAVVIGTANYFSPEQASGRPVDPRSDLYSVGCLLFELLTGRPPFIGDSQIAVAFQHVREPAPPPSSINPAITADVDAVVLRALAKAPDDRYQTAAQMQVEVDRLSAQLGQVPGALPTVVSAPTVAAATVAAPVPPPAPVMMPPVGPTPDGIGAPTVAGGPTEERRSKPGRVVLIALAIVVAVGLAVFAVNGLLGRGGDQTTVAVPALIGEKQAAAEDALRELGLEPKVNKVYLEADETVGTVTTQNPPEGRQVAPATVVTIEVNVGPAEAKMPKNLVGKQVKDVEDQLAEAGFTNVNPRPVTDKSGDAEAGEVLSVDPDEGEPVALDAKVVLRYARSGSEASTTEPTDEPTDESEDPAEPTKTATSEPTDPETSAGGSSTSPETTDPTKTTGPSKTPKSSKPKASKTAKASKAPKATKAPTTPVPPG